MTSEIFHETLVYFFIPLPAPISLPHGWSGQAIVRADQVDAPPTLLTVGPLDRVSASIAVHQLDTEIPLASVGGALRAQGTAFLWEPQIADDILVAPHYPGRQTVFEVMVPLASQSEEGVRAALEVALEFAERVIRAYYLATQHAVPPLNLRNLPPAIPYALRTVKKGEAAPNWPTQKDAQLLLNVESTAIRSQAANLSPMALEEMGQAAGLTGHAPFGGLVDVTREFFLAAESRATIPSAVLCGAAAEVLFRELLLMLLWEEGRCPSSVVELVKEWQVSRLVYREFPPRLRGDWSKTGKGPIASWATHIAALRNRAIHGGYQPTRAEVEAAAAAYVRLHAFVGDRLAATLATYPLTARTFMGIRGVARRGIGKRLERRLRDDVYPSNIATTFERWRREVNRHVNGGPWSGEVADSDTVLVMYCQGQEQWWLVDDIRGLACLAKEPVLTEEGAGNLARVRRQIDRRRLNVHVPIVAQARTVEPLQPQPVWIPTAEAIPLNEYSRYPLQLVPPFVASDNS